MTFIANGQREGWSSDTIVIRAVIGCACASAFVITQTRSHSPLLDFALFRHPQFAAAALLGFVFGAGNFASTYAIPVFVQTVQYFTPTLAGVVTVPAGIVLMCMFPVGGRLVDAFPMHYLGMGGLLLFASGAALLNSADAHTTFWTLAVYVIVGRIGLSILMPTINVSALRALPPEQLNRGSGTINFIRLMGGACGVNGLVVFMEQRAEFHGAALTATQTPANVVSRELLEQVSSLLQAGGGSRGRSGSQRVALSGASGRGTSQYPWLSRWIHAHYHHFPRGSNTGGDSGPIGSTTAAMKSRSALPATHFWSPISPSRDELSILSFTKLPCHRVRQHEQRPGPISGDPQGGSAMPRFRDERATS